jgi:CRP-like cAMP-binding protein
MAKVAAQTVASFPVFAALAPNELEALLAEAKSLRHPKGSDVFTQGEPAQSFFVLVEGRIRAVKLTPEGRQVVVRFVGPGEIFGVAPAIGRSDYPATANAVLDSVSLAWPASAWPRLIAKYPSLASGTMQTVGARLQEAHERIIEMSTEQVEQRVARALLRLAQQAGRKVEEGVQIDFPISRQDVAEMIGTTLHTVSRILSGWEAQGLVRGGRQRIVIRDPHQLVLLAEREKD